MTLGPRAALLIRCEKEDAAALRQQAWREHRSVSGCLLHILERSLWIEEKSGHWLTSGLCVASARLVRIVRPREQRAAVLLRCSEEEAARIRTAAERRKMSISGFVMFSLRRHQKAVRQLAGEGFATQPEVK